MEEFLSLVPSRPDFFQKTWGSWVRGQEYLVSKHKHVLSEISKSKQNSYISLDTPSNANVTHACNKTLKFGLLPFRTGN